MNPPRFPEVVWSYSALDAFEKCPKKFHAERVAKTHAEQDREAFAKGDKVHKFMENYIKFREPVPPGLIKFKNMVDLASRGARNVTAEQKIGITPNLQYTAFFNKDVGLRVVVDFVAERDDAAIVLDWKTSSQPREPPLQLELSALAVLVMKPRLRKVHLAFAYTEFDSKKVVVHRGDIPRIVEEVNPRLAALRDAYRTGQWDPKPCYLCRYCPIAECPNNDNQRL